jgi:hypothetical protein
LGASVFETDAQVFDTAIAEVGFEDLQFAVAVEEGITPVGDMINCGIEGV